MKKILLSFVGVACALLSNAQLIMNEFYVRPNPNPDGHHEYFELKNTSAAPENADCYSLVTYFENAAGQTGFYVVDLPAISVAGHGFVVGSSTAPTFQYQNGTGNADFSWNNGNIRRYVYVNGALTLNNAGAPYDNIFVKSNGAANGQNGVYAMFLFKSSVLVDAFLGNSNTITVPSYITMLGQLNDVANNPCGSISYNFANINNEPDALFGHVNAEAGTDNGYHRVGAGCGNNGIWEKASSPSEHTPGRPNPGNHGNPSASEMIQAEVNCMDNTHVTYNITAGSNGAFPVTVSLYYDANGSQFLDSGDVYIGSQVDMSVNDPAKTFTHASGQEDFIFVFDGKGSCYDTMMPLNCPAAILLPVTFTSFTAAKTGNTVSLKWTTASESNNKGFSVQRLAGNGNWQTLGFINSGAAGGNSNATLTYSFTDAAPAKGVSQYRLQQVDLDGRSKYSDIRTVRFEGTIGKNSIFPNPASGAANLTFGETNSSHDVMISDMNGRVLKQWKGVTDDNMRIDNLTPGVYMIRIVDRSGAQSNERLVVSGR
ncbi:MAG: hypothetical protein JWP27_359 [Flaviaesturariibacter sp.]|nr:hypothetical protein [Flaviaesturariibacter sp.]